MHLTRRSGGLSGFPKVGGRVLLQIGAWVLTAATSGCLYMPPPPAGIAPLPDGDTAVSLHVSADLLPLASGKSMGGSIGFYPSFRFGISDEDEMIFSPWPAVRHWVCLEDGTRAYHQVSLGAFHPVTARGSQIGQYLRYDFRVARPVDAEDRYCGVLYPEESITSTIAGFWLSARGGLYGHNVLDFTVGAAGGLSSDRYGATLEPGLLTLLSGDRKGSLQCRWLRELRAGVWAGR
jgi:hypothetical protein